MLLTITTLVHHIVKHTEKAKPRQRLRSALRWPRHDCNVFGDFLGQLTSPRHQPFLGSGPQFREKNVVLVIVEREKQRALEMRTARCSSQ